MGIETVHPRQMTMELLQKNRHLQTMLDSISEGIIEIYCGQIVYVNPAAVAILDMPRNNYWPPIRWTCLMSPKDQKSNQ